MKYLPPGRRGVRLAAAVAMTAAASLTFAACGGGHVERNGTGLVRRVVAAVAGEPSQSR